MKMKICFIDETAHLGGAEINLLLLASQLKGTGWEAEVVLPEQGPFSSRLEQAGIPITFIPGVPRYSVSTYLRSKYKLPNPLALLADTWQGLLWARRLHRHFQKTRPAIVQTVSMWSHAFGGSAARLAGIPLAAHFQDIVEASSGWGLYRKLVRWWARQVPDRVVCISDKVASQFDGLSPEKVVVIRNTVDVQKFAGWNGHQEGKPGGKQALHLGTVARITPWKGQHIALEAARILKEQNIPFTWSFVGDASLGSEGYFQRLQAQAQRAGLQDQVRFLGWVEDMPGFYHSLDALVHLPVEPEPFGLALAEAMAAGLPVVASAGGGADDLIHGSGGLLVPPGQAGPVAQAVQRLWQAPAERQQRAQAARQFAVQNFSLEAYRQHWLCTYQSILSERP